MVKDGERALHAPRLQFVVAKALTFSRSSSLLSEILGLGVYGDVTKMGNEMAIRIIVHSSCTKEILVPTRATK